MFAPAYNILKDLLVAANIGVAHIELWNGQTKDMAKHNSFLRPAVFVEFTAATPEEAGMKRYGVQVRITLHVISNMISSTKNLSPQTTIDRGLLHLTLLTNIIKVMNDFVDDTNNITGTTWADMQFDSDYDSLIEHLLMFDCMMVFDMTRIALVPAPTPMDAIITPDVLP